MLKEGVNNSEYERAMAKIQKDIDNLLRSPVNSKNKEKLERARSDMISIVQIYQTDVAAALFSYHYFRSDHSGYTEKEIKNIDEAREALKGKCIKELRIIAHGNTAIQLLGSRELPENKHSSKTSGTLPSKTGASLGAYPLGHNSGKGGYAIWGLEIFDGVKEWCKPCDIYLHGCLVGQIDPIQKKPANQSLALMKEIYSRTGCKVHAYKTETYSSAAPNAGDVFPKPIAGGEVTWPPVASFPPGEMKIINEHGIDIGDIINNKK
jgi:hypothetical protein